MLKTTLTSRILHCQLSVLKHNSKCKVLLLAVVKQLKTVKIIMTLGYSINCSLELNSIIIPNYQKNARHSTMIQAKFDQNSIYFQKQSIIITCIYSNSLNTCPLLSTINIANMWQSIAFHLKVVKLRS